MIKIDMIRTGIWVLLIFASCTSRDKEKGTNKIDTQSEIKKTMADREVIDEVDPFYFLADSAFVREFKLKENIPLPELNQPSFGDNESSYSYLKDKANYYQISEFRVSGSMIGKIIYADFPSSIIDGTLKLFFLATYGADNKEIDNIRLAKDEMHSDVSYFETAEVNDLIIRRKMKFTGVSDDGSLIEKEVEKTFRIDEQGKILEN